MAEEEERARRLKEGTLLLWKQQMWGGSASCSCGEVHKSAPVPQSLWSATLFIRHRAPGGCAELEHRSLTHIHTIVPQSQRQRHTEPRGKSSRISSAVFFGQRATKDDQEAQEVSGRKHEAALTNKEANKA